MRILKLISYLILLACFIAGMLSGCAQQNYACQTYAGHHSNLHAKYKTGH